LLSGKSFRLRRDTFAIQTEPDGKKVAIAVEAFRVLSGPRADDRRMVDITWNKAALVIFADDIEPRCVEILDKSVVR
jgi:hypothetical protein